MSRNSAITVHGYIGTTVEEYIMTKNDKPMVKFSICEFRRFGSQTSQNWHQVVVFGEQAIALVERKWLVKGYEAACMGVIQNGSYKNKKGFTVNTSSIIAEWVVCNDRLIKSKNQAVAHEDAKAIDESIPDEDIEDLEVAF